MAEYQEVAELDSGHRPVQSSEVRKEDGLLTKSPDEVKSHWYRNFLNAVSEYQEDVLANMPVRWILMKPLLMMSLQRH